jgi:uncharacterized damage-inducible protein DinB
VLVNVQSWLATNNKKAEQGEVDGYTMFDRSPRSERVAAMSIDLIRSIHGYNEWANDHILTCCERLTSDQFTQDVDVPWGSIRNQLVHQLIVHKRWLSWADESLSGEDAYALTADPESYPDVSSVRSMWQEVNKQNKAFLYRLTPTELKRELRVENPAAEILIQVDQLMLHIAHHSMQHRTETAMALTTAGNSPGDIDYLFYAIQNA